MRPAIRLCFAALATPLPAPHRCAFCGWTGSKADVGELSAIVDWIASMPTDQPVIIPEGGCPRCGNPVFDPSAQRRLTEVLLCLIDRRVLGLL